MAIELISPPPPERLLVAQAPELTDGNGNSVVPGSQGGAVDRAQRLAHEIWTAVEQFRAGRLSWRELAGLKEQARQLWARLPESQAGTLRQAVARIDAQGRAPGDDTGRDVVEVLKAHRDRAQSMVQDNRGDITHGELRRARDFARQVMTARQGHWDKGAVDNARGLLSDIETKYLPALEKLEKRQISAMEQTRHAFLQAPTQEGRQLLQQWRDLLNARFKANDFAPANGPALKQTLAAANEALKPPAAGRPGGGRGGEPTQVGPQVGQQRVVDIDPDGAGPLEATYVGLDRGQNRLQTRVVEVQQYDGRQWATTGFEARGVSVTDLRTNRSVSGRSGRTYRLEGARTPGEAIARAPDVGAWCHQHEFSE